MADSATNPANQASPTTSQKLKYANPDKLKRVHGDITLGETIGFLSFWLRALKISPISPTQPTSKVSFKTDTDTSPREYDVYPDPQARQEFQAIPINALLTADIFQIVDDLREELISNDENKDIADAVRASGQSNLLEEGQEIVGGRTATNEFKLFNYLSSLQKQIYDLLEIVKVHDKDSKFTEVIDQALIEEAGEIDTKEKKAEPAAGDLNQDLGTGGVEQDLEADESLPDQAQPQEITPEETQLKPELQTLYQQPQPRPLLSERPYNVISTQAGFIYNQVLYDIFAIYGMKDVDIAGLNQLAETSSEWFWLERQIRQQIISDLYSMTPAELRALRLGDRSKLALKISQQLLIQKPAFSTQFEAFVMAAPPQVIGQQNKQAVLSVIQQQPQERQQQLMDTFNEHFEAYQNPYANQHPPQEAESLEDLAGLYREKFFAQSVEGLETELLNQLIATGQFQPQHADNIITNIEFLIRNRKDPIFFTELLTNRHLGLICGLDHIPTNDEATFLKTLIADYWYQYRAVLYRITGNPLILTSDEAFLTAAATEQAFGDLMVVRDQDLKEHPNLDKRQFQDIARENTLAHFYSPTARTAPSQQQDQNQATNQLLYSSADAKTMTSQEYDEFLNAQTARALTAIRQKNEYRANLIVQEIYKSEARNRMMVLQSIMAAQEAARIDQAIVAAAIEQQAIQAVQLSDYVQLAQAAQSGQLAFSPADYQAALVREGVVSAPQRQRQNMAGIERAKTEASRRQLEMLLAAGAAAIPQLRIAQRIYQALPPGFKDIIAKTYKDREKIIGGIFLGTGALVTMAIRYLLGNPIVLISTLLGAGVGALLSPFLGPASILGGAGIGFKVGQYIQALPGKAWGAVKSVGNAIGDGFNSLFGGGGENAAGAGAGSVAGVPAAIHVGGTFTLISGAFALSFAAIQGAFLLPTLDSEGLESKYVDIQKVAVEGQKFENENFPGRITYTITINPKESEEPVFITNISDELSLNFAQKEGNPTAGGDQRQGVMTTRGMADFGFSEGDEIPLTEPLELTYTQDFGDNMEDVNITNRFRIDLKVGETTDFAHTAEVICVGDCPQSQGGCWPTSGLVTQVPGEGFSHGEADSYDIAARTGAPVYAPFSGGVCRPNPPIFSAYGIHVLLKADNGYDFAFAHLSYSPVTASCSSPQQIEAGTPIGQVGSTGRSTGPHLHYEVAHNGAFDSWSGGNSILTSLVPDGENFNASWPGYNPGPGVPVRTCYE